MDKQKTGAVTLRWLGQMGLVISSENTTICVDYFASPDAERLVSPPIPADELAGEVQPGIVIPGHWDVFSFNGADPRDFADYLDAKYKGKIRCLIPKIMDEIDSKVFISERV